MFEFKSIFFPDPGYQFVAFLCYGLVFLTAYKRFNTLIINYGAYDAPETARPWTTWLRYHAAAAIYACMYAVAYAVLYQLLHRHPVLINAAIDWVGRDNPAGKTLAELGQDIKLIIPILALLLLILGAEKYRRTSAVDRKLRYYFQQLGSIPRAISVTIRQMKRVEIDGLADICIDRLTAEMKEEIIQPVAMKNSKSLEHLYLRACHLFHQVKGWNSISSEFYPFQSAYHQAFENIKTRYAKIDRNAGRYYQWKQNFHTDADLHAHPGQGQARSRFETAYPKVLTELRKDLKDDLKDILDNIYIFIACAVHNKGLTAKKRIKLLQSFGFEISGKQSEDPQSVDPNDMTILAIFLIFVTPLAAVFARLAGAQHPAATQSATYVVWSAMALFMGLASVAIPIMVNHRMAHSDGRFWRWIKPRRGRPWCSYLVSGLFAGIAGCFAIMLLNLFSPEREAGKFVQTLMRILPWGLVPMCIAFTLGYHLDRKRYMGRTTIAIEIVTTVLAALLGTILALLINAGIVTMAELIPRMYFTLPAAVLLGSFIGAVVPYRLRRQKNTQIMMQEADSDIKVIIHKCVTDLAEIARSGNVTVSTDMAATIPLLSIDAKQVALAVNGLLSNALEFTPQDGRITLSAGQNEHGGVTVAVKDNGIGMSRAKVEAILDTKNDALDDAWSRVGESDYADLLQVYAIAWKHGGLFTLESKRWTGTTVTIFFPKERVCSKGKDRRRIPRMVAPVEALPA
jgi:MFS family permease